MDAARCCAFPFFRDVDVARRPTRLRRRRGRRRCAVLACGSARDRRVGEGEASSPSAPSASSGFADDLPDLPGVEAEPFLDRGERPLSGAAASSSDAPARPSGTVWRTFSISPAARHVDQPFFRAIRDVALERRDAHAPARLRQIHAEQLAPALLAGGFDHELVRPPLAVVGHAHHAPLRRQRHAALLQLLPRGALRLVSRDRQARRTGCRCLPRERRRRTRRAEPRRAPATPSARRAGGAGAGPPAPRPAARARRAASTRRSARSATSSVHRPACIAAPQHDPQRHQRQHDDHQLLEPDAGRLGEEDRQREPDDVEREVQDDPGQQPEVEVEQAEPDRRNDQLDRPRVRRLRSDTARGPRRR